MPSESSSTAPKPLGGNLVWLYLFLVAVSGLQYHSLWLLALVAGIAHLIWNATRVWGPGRLGSEPPRIRSSGLVVGFAALPALFLCQLAVLAVPLFGEIYFMGNASYFAIAAGLLQIAFLLLATVALTLIHWLARAPRAHRGLLACLADTTFTLVVLHLLIVATAIHQRI